MIRRAHLIAMLGLGALLAAAQPDSRHRIVTAAQNFQQRFEDLKGAPAINPVARIFFSLALAGAEQTGPRQ
jgi:hypothetical protein